MKLDAIPSQNPCFPKTNWHSKGGLPGYLSKIGVFQKKGLKSSKNPDFSKVLASKIPMRKDVSTFPTCSTSQGGAFNPPPATWQTASCPEVNQPKKVVFSLYDWD